MDLSGKWQVEVKQDLHEHKTAYHILCEMCHYSDKVVGNMVFDQTRINVEYQSEMATKELTKVPFHGNIKGGHLHIEYDSEDPAHNQFGSAIFTIKSENELAGHFQGYSMANEEVIHGDLTFLR